MPPSHGRHKHFPQNSQFQPPVSVGKTESALPFPDASRQWYTTVQQREAAIRSELGAHLVALRVEIDEMRAQQQRLNGELARQEQRARATAQTEARSYCADLRAELQSLQEEVANIHDLIADFRADLLARRLPGAPGAANRRPRSGIDSDAPMNISDVDESDAETTPNSRYGEVARRGAPLGIAVPGLREIEPGHPRFRDLLSYRRFRLLKRRAHLGPDTFGNIGSYCRRLEH